MTIEIRQLGPDNAALLETIAPEVFDNDIVPQYLANFIDDPRHIMFVAVDNQVVVGMASAVEQFQPDKPPQLFINEVGVAETHRRNGIGRSLIEALIGIAEKKKSVYAWLGTDAGNIAGQACVGSIPGVENPQPFLLYEWNLAD